MIYNKKIKGRKSHKLQLEGFKNLARIPYKYILRMNESAFFKVKSSKRSNPEARTTLDAIHSQKIQNMLDQKDNLISYKNDLVTLKKRIAETSSDIEIWRLEREQENLEKKIKSIESDSDLMDYYLRTGDILYNYYDIQDQIQQGTNTYNVTKAKPGSILAILEEVAQEEGQEVKNATIIPFAQKGLQRNQLLNNYLQLENPSMARNTVEEYDDPWTTCEICSNEMIMCLNEAYLT